MRLCTGDWAGGVGASASGPASELVLAAAGAQASAGCGPDIEPLLSCLLFMFFSGSPAPAPPVAGRKHHDRAVHSTAPPRRLIRARSLPGTCRAGLSLPGVPRAHRLSPRRRSDRVEYACWGQFFLKKKLGLRVHGVPGWGHTTTEWTKRLEARRRGDGGREESRLGESARTYNSSAMQAGAGVRCGGRAARACGAGARA